jgi:hypothetical protein
LLSVASGSRPKTETQFADGTPLGHWTGSRSGCGELIGAYTTILREEGVVAFVSLSPRVRVLWERVKLISIFNTFNTLSEAEDFFRR